jgi:hypothetical protein
VFTDNAEEFIPKDRNRRSADFGVPTCCPCFTSSTLNNRINQYLIGSIAPAAWKTKLLDGKALLAHANPRDTPPDSARVPH